jgi:hypothetical protein
MRWNRLKTENKTCGDSKKLLDVFAVVLLLKYLHEISPVFLYFFLNISREGFELLIIEY